MTEQEVIKQAIIGKRITGISPLSPPSFEGLFNLDSMTLEDGTKLDMSASYGVIRITVIDDQVNARRVCPLCNQGHDPKLIGDSGEGKDDCS